MSSGNWYNPYTVATISVVWVTGHMPPLSAQLIIQYGVFTICTVSDCRRYLEQGGLETPCMGI